MFYVYIYRDPREGKALQPIYVGKGTKRKGRPYSRAHIHWREGTHNSLFRRVLKKIADLGMEPIIEINAEFDDEKEALNHERALVAKFGRRNIGTGTLCNLADGGIGPTGVVISDEIREIRRASMNARYADPAEREKTGEHARRLWADPEYREKVTTRAAEGCRRPEVRDAHGRRFRELWRDDAYREKQIRNITEINSRPEVKAIKSQQTKERWNDPEQREKFLSGGAAYTQTEEYRIAKSIETAAKWRDPEHRSMRIAAISEARNKFIWLIDGVEYRNAAELAKAYDRSIASVHLWAKAGKVIRKPKA